MEKKYWFYIERYVYISIKKDALLLYNTYTGKILEYTAQPRILRLIRRLTSPTNLHVVKLTETELNDPEIGGFVDELRSYFMGDIIDTECSKGKPIQMPPLLKLHKDVKYLKHDRDRSVGEDVMDYLTELSLYINNQCGQNCTGCQYVYRQFPCCHTGSKSNSGSVLNVLPLTDIEALLKEIENCNLTRLNILGGNIFLYSQLPTLLELLKNGKQEETHFYLHYLNVAGQENKLKQLTIPNATLKMPVHFPVEQEILRNALRTASDMGLKVEPIFFIRSEEEFAQADQFTSTNPTLQCYTYPVFDGTNLLFFEKNLLVERVDVEETQPSMNEIYIRQKINLNYFGKLTVLPNKHVLADVNMPHLGSLGSDSIYDVLLRELKEGKSWRRVRGNVMPCKQCSYQNLCPPLSSHNKVIGRNNLCQIAPFI